MAGNLSRVLANLCVNREGPKLENANPQSFYWLLPVPEICSNFEELKLIHQFLIERWCVVYKSARKVRSRNHQHSLCLQMFQKLISAISCAILLAGVPVSSVSIDARADIPDFYLVVSSSDPTTNLKSVRYTANGYSTTLGGAGQPVKFNFSGGESVLKSSRADVKFGNPRRPSDCRSHQSSGVYLVPHWSHVLDIWAA